MAPKKNKASAMCRINHGHINSLVLVAVAHIKRVSLMIKTTLMVIGMAMKSPDFCNETKNIKSEL